MGDSKTGFERVVMEVKAGMAPSPAEALSNLRAMKSPVFFNALLSASTVDCEDATPFATSTTELCSLGIAPEEIIYLISEFRIPSSRFQYSSHWGRLLRWAYFYVRYDQLKETMLACIEDELTSVAFRDMQYLLEYASQVRNGGIESSGLEELDGKAGLRDLLAFRRAFRSEYGTSGLMAVKMVYYCESSRKFSFDQKRWFDFDRDIRRLPKRIQLVPLKYDRSA